MNQPPYGQPPGGAPPGAPQQMQYGYGAPQQQHQQQHQPQQHHYAAPARTDGPKQKGFFGSLFDFSFTSLVAPKVVKVLYVLFLIALVLAVLGGIGSSIMMVINEQIVEGLVTLVALPFVVILYLILGRMWHELIIVMFRIAEDLSEINRKTRG